MELHTDVALSLTKHILLTTEARNFLAFRLSSLLADGGAGGGPTLSFVNGVWVDKSVSLKHSFKQVVDNFYKAVSHEVDFKNRAEEVVAGVNEFV